jgi:hypothetical protein
MKIKNVQGIICLVIFLLFANRAWAEDWILYNTSKEGKMYYDKSSIEEISQNIIRVWTKTILNEKGKTEAFSFLKNMDMKPCNRDTISYELTLEQYDCVNDKYKNISTTIYDKKSNVLLGQKAIVGKWSDIHPKSIVGKLKNIVCSAVKTSKIKRK